MLRSVARERCLLLRRWLRRDRGDGLFFHDRRRRARIGLGYGLLRARRHRAPRLGGFRRGPRGSRSGRVDVAAAVASKSRPASTDRRPHRPRSSSSRTSPRGTAATTRAPPRSASARRARCGRPWSPASRRWSSGCCASASGRRSRAASATSSAIGPATAMANTTTAGGRARNGMEWS